MRPDTHSYHNLPDCHIAYTAIMSHLLITTLIITLSLLLPQVVMSDTSTVTMTTEDDQFDHCRGTHYYEGETICCICIKYNLSLRDGNLCVKNVCPGNKHIVTVEMPSIPSVCQSVSTVMPWTTRSGTYMDDLDPPHSEYECALCDPSCDECHGNSNRDCVNCAENFYQQGCELSASKGPDCLNNTSTTLCLKECFTGFYGEPGNKTCLPCADGNCTVCSDGGERSCEECDSDTVLENGQCLSTCSSGLQVSQGKCVKKDPLAVIIAPAVIGGILFLALLVGAYLFWKKKRKRPKSPVVQLPSNTDLNKTTTESRNILGGKKRYIRDPTIRIVNEEGAVGEDGIPYAEVNTESLYPGPEEFNTSTHQEEEKQNTDKPKTSKKYVNVTDIPLVQSKRENLQKLGLHESDRLASRPKLEIPKIAVQDEEEEVYQNQAFSSSLNLHHQMEPDDKSEVDPQPDGQQTLDDPIYENQMIVNSHRDLYQKGEDSSPKPNLEGSPTEIEDNDPDVIPAEIEDNDPDVIPAEIEDNAVEEDPDQIYVNQAFNEVDRQHHLSPQYNAAYDQDDYDHTAHGTTESHQGTYQTMDHAAEQEEQYYGNIDVNPAHSHEHIGGPENEEYYGNTDSIEDDQYYGNINIGEKMNMNNTVENENEQYYGNIEY